MSLRTVVEAFAKPRRRMSMFDLAPTIKGGAKERDEAMWNGATKTLADKLTPWRGGKGVKEAAGQRALVVVHPGSLCGSLDFNLGAKKAAEVRKRIADHVAAHKGPVIGVMGNFNDEIDNHPEVARIASHFTDTIDASPTDTALKRAGKQIRKQYGDHDVTGAWGDDGEGCAHTLAAASKGNLHHSVARLTESAEISGDDEATRMSALRVKGRHGAPLAPEDHAHFAAMGPYVKIHVDPKKINTQYDHNGTATIDDLDGDPNRRVVKDYEHMAGKSEFPAITATVAPGGKIIAQDGNHRVMAARSYGKPTIAVHVPKSHLAHLKEDAGVAHTITSAHDGSTHPAEMVDGELRHTHNSEGTPIHDTAEGRANFHRWFGKSKVVDHHGRPQVMMHGTPHTGAIDAFDPKKAGTNTQADGGAFFFTDRHELADHFAHQHIPSDYSKTRVKLGAKGQVIKGYVKMEHPLDLRDDSDKTVNDLRHMHHASTGDDETPTRIRREMTLPNTDLIKTRLPTNLQKLKNYGYDGLIAKVNPHHGGGLEHAILDPNQIKTVDNNGKFSHASDKMREDAGAPQADLSIPAGSAGDPLPVQPDLATSIRARLDKKKEQAKAVGDTQFAAPPIVRDNQPPDINRGDQSPAAQMPPDLR